MLKMLQLNTVNKSKCYTLDVLIKRTFVLLYFIVKGLSCKGNRAQTLEADL